MAQKRKQEQFCQKW